jgi:hypothetical protein
MNPMIKLFIVILFLIGVSKSAASDCRCRLARDQRPVLGNVPLVATGGSVRAIRGRLFYPNGEPVKGAIVEVFVNILETDDWERADYEKVTARPRKIACLTSADGSFCFSGLPSGRYLLRAGLVGVDRGFSAMRMFVRVSPKGSRTPLRMELAQSI